MRIAGLLLLAVSVWGAEPVLGPMDESTFNTMLKMNRGKVVLVDFWATWCAPCLADLPRLPRLAQELHNRGFVLVTVSIDDPEQEGTAVGTLKKAGVREHAYIKRVKNDEAFINFIDSHWGGALPALFLFGRDGRLAKSFIGETEIAKLAAAARSLL